MSDDCEIKEADTIVAMQILRNTYNIDVYKFTKEQLTNMIELLQVAIINRDI